LRQRVEDIPILASHFLKLACSKFGKSGLQFTQGDMERMQSYPWPGNIRELINIIERAVILSQHQRLHLDFSVSEENKIKSQTSTLEQATIHTDEELRQRETDNIIAALSQSKGKVFGQNGAAEILQIKPTTLASRIKRLGINRHQFIA
jgi:DNA-binding NtrC family response regulator